MSYIAEADQAISTLDWEDFEQRHALLADLAEPTHLRALLDNLRVDQELLDMCEFQPSYYKIVLVEKPGKARVRLHVFRDGYADSPHSHRWSFSSRILSGAYTHYIYGMERQAETAEDPRELPAKVVREESRGSSYSLEHDVLHSLRARPNTTSLIIRGPAEKDRSVIVDPDSPELEWRVTAGNEPAEVREAQQFSIDMLDECMAKLGELKVI
jgi:hypothetical protein